MLADGMATPRVSTGLPLGGVPASKPDVVKLHPEFRSSPMRKAALIVTVFLLLPAYLAPTYMAAEEEKKQKQVMCHALH